MLSRAANSIYWMSRYLERADNVARFVAVNAHLILDMGLERDTAQWEPLLFASGDDAAFKRRYDVADEKNVVGFLTFDSENHNSILACVQKARENARTVREVISSEMWETINALYHLVQTNSRKRRVTDLQDFLVEVRNASHMFTGQCEGTMSHGEGWHFAQMGKLLERADKTARLLDVKYFLLLPTPEYFDSPYDVVEWGAVLKSVSGFEMYRKKFHRVYFRNVAQFLVLDPDFPRSIRYCVRTAARSLKEITDGLGVTVPAQNEMALLESMIDDARIDPVLLHGLHEFIDLFQRNLNIVDESLHRSFFSTDRDAHSAS
jgi:uncharacterized alpha-E superfamily protein